MVVANHTFLFADLAGFTAFTAAVGDDRAADMALEFHERVRALLDDHLATSPLPTGGDAARRASVGRPDRLVSVAASRSQPRGRRGRLGPSLGQHGRSARRVPADGSRLPTRQKRPIAVRSRYVHPAAAPTRNLGDAADVAQTARERVPPTPQPGGPKMFAANAYVIRPATETEEGALRELHGPVLIGEVHGRPAAAMAVADGRAVTNPFMPTASLVAHLRMRAGALRAFERMPSVGARMREAVPVT
jgi:hypothetical protein